jgi:hypothetical protein
VLRNHFSALAPIFFFLSSLSSSIFFHFFVLSFFSYPASHALRRLLFHRANGLGTIKFFGSGPAVADADVVRDADATVLAATMACFWSPACLALYGATNMPSGRVYKSATFCLVSFSDDISTPVLPILLSS